KILESLSHLTAAKVASAHPLLPLSPQVRSHLKLSITRKKYSVASLDPFCEYACPLLRWPLT
ncbi:hypothetical protein MUK42_08074, partial [Musa troglodytarum]